MTRLVHVSDLHFGAHDPGLAEALAACVLDLAPSVIVAAGDLTQRGKRSEFAAAAAFFDRFVCPKIIAPGNHDTPLLNLAARALSPFGRFAKRVAAGALPAYADDGALILAFNTARGLQWRLDWSLGVVDLEDLDRLIADFGAAAGSRARIAVCHHPLIDPPNAPFSARTLRGPEGAASLAAAEVDLVLTGHMHVRFAEALPYGDRHTYAVGAGTAFSTRTREAPPGFNFIEVLDGELQVTAYEAHGSTYRQADRIHLPRRSARP
ncbi:MAG: metallophosphoesterase [Alphaproteobacteria bacterium]|nr:metallophosphoesterase [Alphaproteobacteria bacterium]